MCFNKRIKPDMMRLILITLILFIPFDALCQETQEVSDQEALKTEVFSRIRKAASNVQTLSGKFTQEKRLEMLENAAVSYGKFFYIGPDSMRWEVYEPVSTGFSVKGDRGKRWRGESGTMQSFDIRKEPVIRIISDQVFAWAGADFTRLEAGYEITVQESDPVVLKLVPLSTAEKKYLDFIRLIFSVTEEYVSGIEIHEAGGDCTLINFHDVKLNEPLPEDIF